MSDASTQRVRRNALLGHARPVLALASRIPEIADVEDVSTFRARLLDEVRRFEGRCRSDSVREEWLLAARYAICALIDELALNTPWGAHGNWAQQRLLVELHQDASGGELLGQIVDRLMDRAQERNAELLELILVCLRLGFTGPANEWTRTRVDLVHHEVRRGMGGFRPPLSPAVKRRVTSIRRHHWFVQPMLVLGAGLLLLASLFAVFGQVWAVAISDVVAQLTPVLESQER